MKFKHVISTLALAIVTAFGVATGAPSRSFKAVSADPEPTPEYFYMVGDMTEWNLGDDTYKIQSNDPTGTAKLAHTFKKGDAFKVIKTLGSWAGELNYNNVFGNGVLKASPCFIKGENTNIVCDIPGTYWLRVTPNKIFIDKENNLTEFGLSIVYVQLKNWSDTYIYAYDEDTFVNTFEFYSKYPGMPVGGEDEMGLITDGVNFKGELGGISNVEIPYIIDHQSNIDYQSNAKFIINNGDTGEGNQSGDLDVVNGNYYLNTDTDIDGDSTLGAAAAVVFEISFAIQGATNTSLCNLSKSEAQALLDLYDDCDAKSIVDTTTFYSWKEKGSEDKKDFTGLEVIAQLTKIANAPDSNDLLPHELSSTSGTLVVIIIALSTVAAISVGLFFILKKKRHN